MRWLFWIVLFLLLVSLGFAFVQYEWQMAAAYGIALLTFLLVSQRVSASRKAKLTGALFKQVRAEDSKLATPEHFSPKFFVTGNGKFQVACTDAFEFEANYWALQNKLRCDFFKLIPVVVRLVINPDDHRQATAVTVIEEESGKILGRVSDERRADVFAFLKEQHGTALCRAHVIFTTNARNNLVKLDIKFPMKYSWKKFSNTNS